MLILLEALTSEENSLFNSCTAGLNKVPTEWKCLKTNVQARIRLYIVENVLKTYIYDYSEPPFLTPEDIEAFMGMTWPSVTEETESLI